MTFLFNRILDDLHIIISRIKTMRLADADIFQRKKKRNLDDMHDITVFIWGGGDNNQMMGLIICMMFYYNHAVYGTVPLSGCLLDTKHDM